MLGLKLIHVHEDTMTWKWFPHCWPSISCNYMKGTVGIFPYHKGLVLGIFDIFFVGRLIKPLNKQPSCWRIEGLWHSCLSYYFLSFCCFPHLTLSLHFKILYCPSIIYVFSRHSLILINTCKILCFFIYIYIRTVHIFVPGSYSSHWLMILLQIRLETEPMPTYPVTKAKARVYRNWRYTVPKST